MYIYQLCVILTVTFRKVIDELTSDGSCPSAMSAAEIQKVSANMKTALNKYPADRDARASNHDSGPVVGKNFTAIVSFINPT